MLDEAFSHSNTKRPDLSVVIPLRITSERDDPEDRIQHLLADPGLKNLNVDFILVDDGSDLQRWKQCQAKLPKNVRSARTNSPSGGALNCSKARNLGVSMSLSDKVLLMDIDIHVYPGFYARILAEAEALEIGTYPTRFLMIPVIYLTKLGADAYFMAELEQRHDLAISYYLKGDSERVEKFSSGTSVVLMDREHYVRLGGFDESFTGWGFEDHEFITRLIRHDRFFPLPAEWYSDKGNFNTARDYLGWRSIYRLYGDWCFAKGLCVTHIPHPVGSRENLTNNLELFIACRKDWPYHMPIGMPGKYVNSVIVQKNFLTQNSDLTPFLGRMNDPVVGPDGTLNLQDFETSDSGVDFCLFSSPYANTQVADLYERMRLEEQPVVVAGLGALPDSLYFDSNGFLAESDSYHPSRWDRRLHDEERISINEYIGLLLDSTITFGGDSEPIESRSEREAKGSTSHCKILLVALQDRNDVNVQHFAGAARSVEHFCAAVEDLASKLPQDWRIVWKTDPLDPALPLPSCGTISEDVPVNDLIRTADAVLTINADLGLKVMMTGAPLLVMGNAWYNDPRLVNVVKSVPDILTTLAAPMPPDHETMLRFVHYLRFEFYSFGKASRAPVRKAEQVAQITAIDIYELRWPFSNKLHRYDIKPVCDFSSPLFDRYKDRTGRVCDQKKNRFLFRYIAGNRKLSKLVYSPRAFFRDSKNPMFRILKYIFLNE